MSSLNAKHFHDDNAARLYLEAIRWPRGPACPHCGAIGEHCALQGKAHRPGIWKCKDCRQQFSVTVGTVVELNHTRGEYARGNVTTNTVEGYFSIFKRGMKSVYHHCDEAHLHRYFVEFDFRYNNRIALEIYDTQRTVNALAGIGGKRLTYRRPHEARA